jgi:hypothetical protein
MTQKVMKVISKQEEIHKQHVGRHNTFQFSTLDGDGKIIYNHNTEMDATWKRGDH